MTSLLKKQYLFQVMRTGCAMCFIGHGVFGLITKAVWCNYFAIIGIGKVMAYRLMPVVGSVDILLGVSLLVYPVRAVPLWLLLWGFVTAALRPLSGEPFPELIERAGNYLLPAALLVLCRPGVSFTGWFSRISGPAPGLLRFATMKLILRISVFLLMAGHAWLNLSGKPALLAQYRMLGINDVCWFSRLAGSIEMLLAAVTLFHPFRSFLVMLLFWKMGTELFYPHYQVVEWIERGGSYASILGLWLCLEPVAGAGMARSFAARTGRRRPAGHA